jgi:hypothetical protein
LPFLKSCTSDHCDKLALHISVAVDVPLGGLDRAMTGEQLDIPQRATGLVDKPRRPGDERPATGMRRAAVETDARLNQTTMLNGIIGPPRSDRMTGPLPVKSLR